MGVKIKFFIHPLFFIFGLYFAFTGKVFSFLTYTFCAVLHELGHAYISEKLGYMLAKVTLMPYGAVISGDLTGLKFSDEIAVAFAGPILNFIIAICFISLWWIFPDTYAYTDIIVSANLSLALINLLPAYPLDGGRVLYASIAKFNEKKARVICKIVSLVIAILIVGLFVYSVIVKQTNFSILFFALFILFGAFSKGKDNKYVRFYSQFKQSKLQRGQEEKVLVFGKNSTVKDLLKKVKADSLYSVKVIGENGEIIKTFSSVKVLKILSEENIYSKLEKIV
ncbi:MAG: site-2 protease family protein [Clostridia bacterium]|nr:site-2 protease family protein [Clostridia bacterium]